MSLILESDSVGRRDLVVTFIVNHPKAILLLWTARKRAEEIGGDWRVVYIETPNQRKGSYVARHEQILHLLTRAKQMGAETDHVEALSMLQGVETYLNHESGRLACVVIGSVDHEYGLLKRLRSPSWVKLVQLASQYTKVESVPLTGQFQQPFYLRAINRLRDIEPRHIIYALLAMLVPFALAAFLQSLLPPAFFRINAQNIDNMFFIAVAVVAGRFGLVPGLVAAIVGFFIENYYFTVPYNQLKLYSMTDISSMLLFLTAALLIAIVTSRMRGYAQKIKKREMHTEMLFNLYRLTLETYTRQEAIEVLQKSLEQMLKADIAFFLPPMLQPGVLEIAAPPSLLLTDNDRKALTTCWTEMKCTGAASPYNPGTRWRFEPMIAARGEVGVIGVRVRDTRQLDAWFGRLFTASADQIATILSQIELERSMEATRMGEEREKLRVMLLSSVSHDLKTPLAGIIGALSAVQTLGGRLKPGQQKELIDSSLEEAQRLDSFITNILDMTRLETGNIKFRQEWIGVRELTDNITKRLSHRLKLRELGVHFPRAEVEARMDSIMTGQVLQNLLDNACKYTPPGTRIDIIWSVDEVDGMICSVRDYGKGIPPEKLANVFDKYTRLQKQDMQTPGTGLGLAIAKAVMEGQGGWIRAANHPDGGAIFTFCLPQWRPLESTIPKEEDYAAIG